MSLVGFWRANVKPKVGGTNRRHLSSEVERAWVKLRAEWNLATETCPCVFTVVRRTLTVGLFAQNSQDTSLYISCKLTSEQWQATRVLCICVQFSLWFFLSVIFLPLFFFPHTFEHSLGKLHFSSIQQSNKTELQYSAADFGSSTLVAAEVEKWEWIQIHFNPKSLKN